MKQLSFFLRARLAAILLLAVLSLCAAVEASAHRVNIFAWVEGDAVLVECSFRRNSPVRAGTVTVFDAVTGRALLEGKTSDKGRFSFPVPPEARGGHGLRLRISAGEGHQNEWLMDAAEFAALAPASPARSAPAAPATPAATPAPAPEEQGARRAPALTEEEFRALVDAALESRLGPIRRELAALRDDGPSLRDVIGGLGWIMGIVGAGLYFARRRP